MTHQIKTVFATGMLLLSVSAYGMSSRVMQLPVVIVEENIAERLIKELKETAQAKDIEKYKEVAAKFHENRAEFKNLTQVIGADVRPDYLLDFALWLALEYGHHDMRDALIQAGANKKLVQVQELRPLIAQQNIDALAPLLDAFIERKGGCKSPQYNPVLTFVLNEALRNSTASQYKDAIVRHIIHQYSCDVTVNSKAGFFGKLDKSVIEYARSLPQAAKIVAFLQLYAGAEAGWKTIHEPDPRIQTKPKTGQSLALGMAAAFEKSFGMI